MATGRPPLDAETLSQRITASDLASERTRVILHTIAGELDIASAAAQLGISDERFRQLREQAVQGMAESLEPQHTGRKGAPPPSEKDDLITELETENQDMRIELEAARIRSEIALTMPHLLEDKPGVKKKRKAQRRKRL